MLGVAFVLVTYKWYEWKEHAGFWLVEKLKTVHRHKFNVANYV